MQERNNEGGGEGKKEDEFPEEETKDCCNSQERSMI